MVSAACSGTMLIRSAQAHDCAFRVGNGILRPLGNSTKRRTNCPALSTTYLVPSGRFFGRRYVLRTFGPHFGFARVPPSDTLCPDSDKIIAIPSWVTRDRYLLLPRCHLTTATPFLRSRGWGAPPASPWLARTSSGVRSGTPGKTGRPPGSRTPGARVR